MLAWMVCHSQLCRKVALRAHLWHHRDSDQTCKLSARQGSVPCR
jgi:hypothetical protein